MFFDKVKKVTAVLCICTMAMPVFADDDVADYYFSDLENGVVTIHGTLPQGKAGDIVTVTVLNPGYTEETADAAEANEAINNMEITHRNEDGSYSAELKLRNLGDYSYRVIVRGSSDKKAEYTDVRYYTSGALSDVCAKIATAIKAGDSATLKTLMNEDLVKVFGIRTAELGNITIEELCNLAAKKDGNVEATAESMKRTFEKMALLDMISNKKAGTIFKSAEENSTSLDILCGGNKDYAPYKVYGKAKSEIKNEIFEAIDGKKFETFEDFEKSFAVAVLNKTLKNAETYLEARDIMEKYSPLFKTNYTSSYVKLNATSRANAETALITSVKSKEVTEVDQAAQRFLDCIKNESKGSSTQLGGGSSGSSSGGSNISVSSGIINQITQNKENAKNDVFVDLEGFDWAKESIFALEKDGIISGKEKMKFEPASSVTREEFVKMIVAALDIKTDNPECGFEDVIGSDWFYSYVAEAYTAGIISGINEHFFGSGLTITREEMAAIIFRAVQYKGISLENAEPSFVDANEISDYAKEAVGTLNFAGIINGVGGGYFKPKATAQRAEAAKLVYAVREVVKQGGLTK